MAVENKMTAIALTGIMLVSGIAIGITLMLRPNQEDQCRDASEAFVTAVIHTPRGQHIDPKLAPATERACAPLGVRGQRISEEVAASHAAELARVTS